MLAEFSYKDTPQFSEARAISKFAQDLFLQGEISDIQVLFTRFISTINQKPVLVPFLPIDSIENALQTMRKEGESEQKYDFEFLFEPGPEQVLGAMLPHYLNFLMYHILLESKASEHSARMIAMKNATDNATQLIKELTLTYNKMRQAAITKEILEISTAQMAME